MLATAYRTEEPALPAQGQGMIARYAWGTDYHDVIRERLHALADFHRELTPGAAVRGVVDTAPLLEREFAELAGLGWVGKNTLLLNRLSGKLVPVGRLADQRNARLRCTDDDGPLRHLPGLHRRLPDGRDRRAYRLDARKCISYLTIELREVDSAWAARLDWPANLWLRHLPGRLSVQSPVATDRRSRFPAASRFESDRSGRIASHGRYCLPGAVPRQSRLAGQAARFALPGCVCPGESAGCKCATGPRRWTSRHRSSRVRGMCLGSCQILQ